MHIRSLGVFVLLGLAVQAGWNSSAQAEATPWEEAKLLADAGKNAEALELLQKTPARDARDFYNLGTLSLRMSRFGQAVAFLEKAYQLKPFDSDIRHNLNIARTELARVIGSGRLDPASSWLESFGDMLAPSAARAALAALALLLLLVGFSEYRKSGAWLEKLGTLSGILGILGVLLSGLMLQAEWLHQAHPAAVCTERLVIRSGPGNHFLELSSAEAGMKLRVLSAASTPAPQSSPAPEAEAAPTENWKQVRYAEDRIGWVRESGLLLL